MNLDPEVVQTVLQALIAMGVTALAIDAFRVKKIDCSKVIEPWEHFKLYGGEAPKAPSPATLEEIYCHLLCAARLSTELERAKATEAGPRELARKAG